MKLGFLYYKSGNGFPINFEHFGYFSERLPTYKGRFDFIRMFFELMLLSISA